MINREMYMSDPAVSRFVEALAVQGIDWWELAENLTKATWPVVRDLIDQIMLDQQPVVRLIWDVLKSVIDQLLEKLSQPLST